MEQQQLFFSSEMSVQKPNTIRNKATACPFCQIDELEDILERQESIIWLMNKYPTLKDTHQTVIIETDECTSDMRHYSTSHMRNLMRFCLTKWQEIERTGTYESVILFKNHGPYSGGSISHPHMQIIGMQDVDYHQNITMANFEGTTVYTHDGIELTVSAYPIIGFTEFNLFASADNPSDTFSDMLQVLVRYILDGFHKACNSFNLFFYRFNDKIICKAIPRFVVSPLFVGYKIPQVLTSKDRNRMTKDLFALYSAYARSENT
ncbi:DUF4931 domain-containing protein [Pradoshia sp.]